MDKPIGDLAGVPLRLLLSERIDQFDGREEPNPFMVMLNGLDAYRGGNVHLARAGAADQNDIVGVVEELAAMKLADRHLVNLAAGKI